MKIKELRSEHQIIANWITPGARILDLGVGVGDGHLWKGQTINVERKAQRSV